MGGTGGRPPVPERGRPIRVVVCDDHRILTDTLAMAIEQDPTISLAAPPFDAPEDAIEACRTHHPDVALMDLAFAGRMAGVEAIRRIRDVSPSTAVVVMTAHPDDALLVEAVEAGASGFLSKTEGLEAVIEAARGAARGDVLIDPELLRSLQARAERERAASAEATDRLNQLTAREVQVLRLLGDGCRNDVIAERLFITEQTVQTHVRNILAKLGVRSRLEAVVFAWKHGALETWSLGATEDSE